MPLCHQCQKFGTTPPNFGHGSQSYPRRTIYELLEAVGLECYFCAQLWASLTEEQKKTALGPAFSGIGCIAFGFRQGNIEDPKLSFLTGSEIPTLSMHINVKREFFLINAQGPWLVEGRCAKVLDTDRLIDCRDQTPHTL